jgi:hypothetical protein
MNSDLNCLEALSPNDTEKRLLPGSTVISVATRMDLAAPAEDVWERLMFYEQIEEPPPWLLRLLLPVPLRTEGRPRVVGDEIRCVYQGGDLIKRVTRMTRGWNYEFDVVRQNLSVGGGIKLAGGSYTLITLANGGTRLILETLYTSPWRPRWLCRWIEERTCHLFHRHILKAMRDAAPLSTADA